MRILLWAGLLICLPLYADFFPPTVTTAIKAVGKSSVTLRTPLPVQGMSGIVIHAYGNDIEAITGRIIQNSDGTATLAKGDILRHNTLPTVNTAVSTNDKVIGGYLYDNVLLLAPDAQTYTDITSAAPKNWIHPDLYALFLSMEGEDHPTKKNLAKFAKEYEVGLIYVVKHKKAILLDPISGQHVAEKTMQNLPSEGKYPFYMRLDTIDTSLFGGASGTKSYYKAVEAL